MIESLLQLGLIHTPLSSCKQWVIHTSHSYMTHGPLDHSNPATCTLGFLTQEILRWPITVPTSW
jgi:hypothetical protein